jgi:hypothetical protein
MPTPTGRPSRDVCATGQDRRDSDDVRTGTTVGPPSPYGLSAN